MYNSRWAQHPAGNANEAAECLYMIVMLSTPDARSQFSDSEIGDTDNNGFPEFLDGWGNPIFFLRWSPVSATPIYRRMLPPRPQTIVPATRRWRRKTRLRSRTTIRSTRLGST